MAVCGHGCTVGRSSDTDNVSVCSCFVVSARSRYGWVLFIHIVVGGQGAAKGL